MGKHSNSEGLRLVNTQEWHSQFYADSYNYSNIIVQDQVIHDYVLNFLTKFKIQTARIDIKRGKFGVLIEVQSYNDYSTFTESFINSYSQQLQFKKQSLKSNFGLHDASDVSECLDSSFYNEPKIASKQKLPSCVIFREKNGMNFFRVDAVKHRKLRYSMRRALALNLSYYLKTNVIVRNRNIINPSPVLLDLFWSLAHNLRSPLPSHLNLKFIYLVYHSLQHKSALLLCRYLSVLIPRFCKKKRKDRKVNPFIYSLKKLIKTLFSNRFCSKNDIKGIKIIFKGRLNGSRRKGKHVLEYGQTTVHSFSDNVSYHQEDCFTLFGVSGIKVWIIY
jgi:hypothetical protein